MYSVEGCYVNCDYVAYGYVDGWLSVYWGQHYGFVGIQVHELGHNFGLRHSGGLDGKPYSDHTCMMVSVVGLIDQPVETHFDI
jgi:hypothetical protein